MSSIVKFRVWDDQIKYMNYKVMVGMYGPWNLIKDDNNYTACSLLIDEKHPRFRTKIEWVHFEPYMAHLSLMEYVRSSG